MSVSDLSPLQKDYLARNSFVVLPWAGSAGMAEAYADLKQAHLPIFVTTDALLHTAHLFFDYLLRIVEVTALRPQLVALTEALLAAAADDFRQAGDMDVREAARRNLAFFSTGARLLNPKTRTPHEVEDLVQPELNLTEKRPVELPPPASPVLGIREDYTQYIPRGHYTRNDAFRSYFLAALWYGRMGFFVYPSESHALAQADTERLARQALLITRNLHRQRVDDRPAIEVWRGVYNTTALFAGRAEDPGADEYAALAQAVYGGLPDPDQLADTTRLTTFMLKVCELAKPRVLSTFYLDGDGITPRWQDGTHGFRFLSQRFVPDTHIFSDLVYDRVGRYTGQSKPFTYYYSLEVGPYRAVPRGLDVLAVFGSELAERILRDEGDTEYEGYSEKLAELRALYAHGDWERDAYYRWLGVLRSLLDNPPETAPAFMRNEAWARKQLNAALGAWAELRHDTILYIKQSYTSVPRSVPPSPPPVYVEPCPGVYEQIGAMVAHLRGQLSAWGMLDPQVRDKMAEFEGLLAELTRITGQELQGQFPARSESENLAFIGSRLKALLEFPQKLRDQITSGTDDRMALVADVHTHLEGDQVLEEAVGDPFLICVEIERDHERVRHWGAVFSYYEFKHPISDRLTDEAWQAMSPKPPVPMWTSAYLPIE